jgi:hypothetical protein
MQRIRWVRISAMVAAICLIGAIQYSDEVAVLAAGLPDPNDTVVPGQTQVSQVPGVIEVLSIPFAGKDSRNMATLGPLKCNYDERISTRVCASRRPTDSSFAVLTSEVRSADGAVQRYFNAATSDTVIEHIAKVKSFVDKDGHPTSLSVRSFGRYAGYSSSKNSVVMNGTDTIYKTVQRGQGLNRLHQVVEYSNVTLPVFDARAARVPRHPYPMTGVVYTTQRHDWISPNATRKPMFTNAIVYFDGTRTPEAYLDGKRYKLDLHTGLATPYAGA